MDFSRIGVVTGLTAEAQIARRLFPRVAVGGGDSLGAAEAARRLIAEGADALISFGLAGGLDPAVRSGSVIIPVAVLTREGLIPTDLALNARFGGATGQNLLGGDRIVVTACAKYALWETSGCAAVDLESGPVGLAAMAHGLPFAVVRAVCDPAARDLPPAALFALDGGGVIGVSRVLASVLRQPRQIPGLIALARDASAARRALVRWAGATLAGSAAG